MCLGMNRNRRRASVFQRGGQAGICQPQGHRCGNTVCCSTDVSLLVRNLTRRQPYPSTSPSFLPFAANSWSNSTPTNRPGFPLTLPMNRTVPYMSPGTLTISPTSREPLETGVAGMVRPFRACSEALRFISAVVMERKEGEEAVLVLRMPERCRPGVDVTERRCCLGVVLFR